jgi:hypothetical protein
MKNKGTSWRFSTIQPRSNLGVSSQRSNLGMENTSPSSRFENRTRLRRTFGFSSTNHPLCDRDDSHSRIRVGTSSQASDPLRFNLPCPCDIRSVLYRVPALPVILPLFIPSTCHRHGPTRSRQHKHCLHLLHHFVRFPRSGQTHRRELLRDLRPTRDVDHGWTHGVRVRETSHNLGPRRCRCFTSQNGQLGRERRCSIHTCRTRSCR